VLVAKKKHVHHEEHIDETWLIPYADLLTLLLALFIVLFASSKIDVSKFEQMIISLGSAFNGGSSVMESTSQVSIIPEPAVDTQRTPADEPNQLEKKHDLEYQKETIELENLKQRLDQFIKDNGLTGDLETKLTPYSLMVTIRDSALFGSGSAEVRPEARRLAIEISNMLVPYPKKEIIVAGHTDNRPIFTREFKDNWDLSSKRALNFMKILLLNEGLKPTQLSATGYGEYRPIETNQTEEGRASNRRVEVSILRNFIKGDVKP
jgi:chemotaxis protein MotB